MVAPDGYWLVGQMMERPEIRVRFRLSGTIHKHKSLTFSHSRLALSTGQLHKIVGDRL